MIRINNGVSVDTECAQRRPGLCNHNKTCGAQSYSTLRFREDRAKPLFQAPYRSRQHDVDIKVARIFNTYGPRMAANDGRVVSNFIVQAMRSEDITIYGDGMQTRSFCYVDDLADGMVRMMESRDGFAGPVNLGNPREFTMLELVKTVVQMTGSKSAIKYCPLSQNDPKQRKPVIDLARKELGWEPTVQLEEGLKKTIAYFERIV